MKAHHKSIAVALICASITPTLFGGTWFKSCKPTFWDKWPAGIGIIYPRNEVVCLPNLPGTRLEGVKVDGTECVGQRTFAGVCSDEFGFSICDATKYSGWGEVRDIRGTCIQMTQRYIPCKDQKLDSKITPVKTQCDYKR
jgi:hypothetical protein